MPIHPFDGETFVAFTDISGFKAMMQSEERAIKALDHLNQTGYSVLQNHADINGIFVSDCGILFARQQGDQGLFSLLATIEHINKEMLQYDVMMTTSIAFGRFYYQDRLEFHGIDKNMLYGNAYLSAYLDNENGKPRIQPGQCRIVVSDNPTAMAALDRVKGYDDRIVGGRKHCYFYWMVGALEQIDAFDAAYNDSYDLKYKGMLAALKAAQATIIRGQ